MDRGEAASGSEAGLHTCAVLTCPIGIALSSVERPRRLSAPAGQRTQIQGGYLADYEAAGVQYNSVAYGHIAFLGHQNNARHTWSLRGPLQKMM